MRLAIDIDDTICDTNVYWMNQYLQRHSINGATAETRLRSHGTVRKLRIKAADAIVEELFSRSEAWMSMPPISRAAQTLSTHRNCIALYLSTRPEELEFVTNWWLRKHRFPERAIILRPRSVTQEDGDAWKAKYITQHQCEIDGIIDDSNEILTLLNDIGFEGMRLHFSHLEVMPNCLPTNTVSFSSWGEVDVYLRKLVKCKDERRTRNSKLELKP